MASGFFEFQKQMARAKRGAGTSAAMAGEGSGTPASLGAALTVSQLNNRIKRALNAGMPASVVVKGEVGNFKKQAGSGHFYFSLRDAESCLDCVMFASNAERVKFTPTDAMELLATGRVDVYVARGRYQLYVESLQPVGTGALELAFKQMRERLEREGLFALDRKRPMPQYPMNVAIVTSAGSAAYQDILKVLRRFPWLRLMLCHVPVQGDAAAAKIAEAISMLSDGHARVGGVDVILVARGGGSLEDLWCFNEESVGRAIFRSNVPVITGIGHEVDTSIADLVADYFAHTPTEAAQVLIQHWRVAEASVDRTALAMARALQNATSDARHRLRHVERHEFFRRPTDRIESLRQMLANRERALHVLIAQKISLVQRRLQEHALSLARHGPQVVLARLRSKIDAAQQRLSEARAACMLRLHDKLARQTERLMSRHPRNRLTLESANLANLQKRLSTGMRSEIAGLRLSLEGKAKHLHAIGPAEVLRRGYSITTNKRTGQVIRSASQIAGGERLLTRLAEGEVQSVAEDPKQPGLFS